MTTTKLTPGERRALQAVKRGDVLRTYDARGNHFTVHPNAARPHPSATVLWRLDKRGMLSDTGKVRGVLTSTYTVDLSPRGTLIFETGHCGAPGF